MTQVVEKSDHTTAIWPERLQELQHLLVRPSIPTGQVVDHHVLEMEISDGHLIGVAVRNLECLGNTHSPTPSKDPSNSAASAGPTSASDPIFSSAVASRRRTSARRFSRCSSWNTQ